MQWIILIFILIAFIKFRQISIEPIMIDIE